MKNQYTLTVTREPLPEDESKATEEPESVSLQISASNRKVAIAKILDLFGQDAINESLLQDNQKVTIELKQN